MKSSTHTKTQLLITSFASNTCRCISNPSCRRRAAQRMAAAFEAELDFEEVCDQSFSWQLLQWLLNKTLDSYPHWGMHKSINFDFGHQIQFQRDTIWSMRYNYEPMISDTFWPTINPQPISHPQLWIISGHHLQVFHLTRAQQKHHGQQVPKIRRRQASPGRPHIGHCGR